MAGEPCATATAALPSPGARPQVLWTFSIYLEAVAILPQLVLLQRTNNIDNLTGNYVFLLG
jgi:ER lumen protein retaining receptor